MRDADALVRFLERHRRLFVLTGATMQHALGDPHAVMDVER